MLLQGYGGGNLILQGLYSGPSTITPDIVVEDGSGIVEANSYVTTDEALRYAKSRGRANVFKAYASLTGLSEYEAVESALLTAKDYLETIGDWKGLPVWLDQPLAWPRSDVYINRVQFATDAIPVMLKQAQIEVALSIASGANPLQGVSGQFVTREKVGPIETEYSEAVGFGGVSMPLVDGLLKGLRNSFGGFTTIRV